MREFIRKRGFTLIEINLAIFMVAMGMLTLFSLFPAGLKQIETAHESTQEALFGDYVLSTLRADAMMLTAEEWLAIAPATFPDFVFNSITPEEFPAASGLYMRYRLQLDPISDDVWSATLWCRSGQYGTTVVNNFQEKATKLYTELFYSGMP